MDLTTISVIITIIAGAISIIQGLLGIIGRLRGTSPKSSAPTAPSDAASPAPPSSYGASPIQGYAPAPVQTAQQERPARRFGTHPWIALGVGAGYLLYGAGASQGGVSTPPTGGAAIVVLAGVLLVAAAIVASLVSIVRQREWGWLLALILGTALTAFVFGIIGPAERRA